MSKTGKLSQHRDAGAEVSDLRSQLIAKLGVEAPEPAQQVESDPDPLGPQAHWTSDWYAALVPALKDARISLNAQPSYGAVRNAHDVLMKHLKAHGDKRTMATLRDLRSRYTKRREKLAWSRLKKALEEGGVSAKVYRAVKQSTVDPELALKRWSKVQNKTLNGAAVRQALIDG